MLIICSGKLKVVLIIESPYYRRSYKITAVCLSVQQFGIFLRNGSLIFLIFGTMVDNWNIQKLTEPFFLGKFIFAQIWAKNLQNGPIIKILGFFEKFCHVSFSWKWSKIKIDSAIDISPPYLVKFWFSSYESKYCQPIKLQDLLKCNILRKKWMIKFIFCMHWSLLQVEIIILSEYNQTCSKYPK